MEIRIGVVAPLSGELADTIGQPTLEAAELAVMMVNEAGGLEVGRDRQRVLLLIEDNEDKAEVSVSAAQQLINQENVVALIGPQLSRNAIPVANLAEQARIPLIAPTSTNPATTADKAYAFRVVFLDDIQGRVLAQFAYQELGARKAAVLYDIASAYNKGLAEIFKRAFEAAGGQVVAFESYTADQPDLSRQLARIRAGRPDIIFLPNYHTEIPAQARQIRQMGLEATLIGSDSWNGLTPADLRLLEGAFFSNHYALDADTAVNQTFIQAYQQAYGHLPTSTAAATYDAFGLLFQAIQDQGQANPEAIRAGLAAVERYHGVTGVMEFQAGGNPIKDVFIMQIAAGEFEFYKTVDPERPAGEE